MEIMLLQVGFVWAFEALASLYVAEHTSKQTNK